MILAPLGGMLLGSDEERGFKVRILSEPAHSSHTTTTNTTPKASTSKDRSSKSTKLPAGLGCELLDCQSYQNNLCVFYAIAYSRWLEKGIYNEKSKNTPKLKGATERLFKEFQAKCPEDAENFRGVTQRMLPVIEEMFHVCLDIYRKLHYVNGEGKNYSTGMYNNNNSPLIIIIIVT